MKAKSHPGISLYHSSVRAIRKAALACLLRLRRYFAHLRALGSYDCQVSDSYASINLPPDIIWLNCFRNCSFFC